MRTRISTLACLILALCCSAASGATDSGGVNAPAQTDKPYLILISIDGFRWDYQARYETAALDRIAAGGVRADALIPVFPTLTFPNHYSIATGLYPANHGLVGNRFFSRDRQRYYSLSDRASVEDGSWYGGRPIWVAAESNGMVSAAFFFVGTEADVDGIRPSDWRSFNGAIAGARRVDQALEWLSLPAAKRPHLITLYFEDVDEASHDEGIGSLAMIEAVRRVDGHLERLLTGIDALPIADDVYVVIVSDHGQSSYRRDLDTFIIDDVVDLDGIRAVDHGSVAFLYFDRPDPDRAIAICDAINARWRHGQAVTPAAAPASWHTRRDSAFADVIVQADPRASVRSTRRDYPTQAGDHGWAPEFRDMHGIFLATGPRLPGGRVIPPIEAVDIYPLMLEILGLPQEGPIDGDPSRLLPLLSAE